MLMSKSENPARVHYMANNFRLLTNGDHVVCAQSGVPIALENLRYWSVAKQEAYASAELATKAALGK